MKSCIAVVVMLVTVSVAAQQPPPAKTTPPPVQAKAPVVVNPPPQQVFDPSAGGQAVNIRLDVSVLDQREGVAAQPKTLMVILADKAMGQTRAAYEDRSIKVDARPTIVDGQIRVNATVNSAEPPKTFLENPPKQPDPLLNWTNSFALLLQSGKPIVALETTDPATKRKMSIEVKATILK